MTKSKLTALQESVGCLHREMAQYGDEVAHVFEESDGTRFLIFGKSGRVYTLALVTDYETGGAIWKSSQEA